MSESSEFVLPALDPVAAARWQARAASPSPWLHEEVARRMHERLSWLAQPPASWCHWDPVRGGLQGHALVSQQFPQAPCVVYETGGAAAQAVARAQLGKPWWSRLTLGAGQAPRFAAPAEGSVQMLWSNMGLHLHPDPPALLERWRQALAVDGYLMFSCLGPDTLRELRALYAALGWPPPGHALTDMHDWGDWLVRAGFADPVMDMERITLTFPSPERLLQELRELGRNLHPQRFAGLRGRGWLAQLQQGLQQQAGSQPLALTFEVIYGHAIKPTLRVPVQSSSAISLSDMRSMLQTRR